jgi:hypothetical protein
MLRFGLGLAVALGALAASAPAQSAETLAAPSDSSMEKARHARGKDRPVITAQPLMVPPLPERKTAAASPVPPVPETWTQAEIDTAKAACAAAVKGLNVQLTYEPPIKEGLCGAPAPIRVSRLGNVTFKPAALINCGMLQPLNTWISKDLQRTAQRQFGAKITEIEVMSDYSCRTAFGRVGRKLSQHAYVDALDIRGFVTARGEQVAVLNSWGATKRDIIAAAEAARIKQEALAAAQAEAAKAEHDNLKDAKSGASQAQAPTATASVYGTPTTGAVKATRSRGVDMVTVILPGASKKQQFAARLGGPTSGSIMPSKSKSVGEQPGAKTPLSTDAWATPPDGPRARFLREAHASACRIFGTTLGPEANEAHRNHFHVDMAERKIKKICD